MDLPNRDIIKQQYDRYVEYYNESKNPITSYSELLTIKDGLKQRLDELKERVDLFIGDIEYYLGEVYDSTLSSDEEDGEENLLASNYDKLAKNIIEHIKWEVDNFLHISHPNNFMNQNYSQIEDICKAYNKSGQGQKFKKALKVIISYGEEYEQAYYHLRGIKSVTGRIINENYPSKLRDYRKLDEQEKVNLLEDRRVGAPLNAEVPQYKVEQIVTKLLHQYIRGQTITTNKNGDKRMYKVVHDSGKHEGNANINQIFKYFESAHPDLINISDRQFKKRIKKAVPEGMK